MHEKVVSALHNYECFLEIFYTFLCSLLFLQCSSLDCWMSVGVFYLWVLLVFCAVVGDVWVRRGERLGQFLGRRLEPQLEDRVWGGGRPVVFAGAGADGGRGGGCGGGRRGGEGAQVGGTVFRVIFCLLSLLLISFLRQVEESAQKSRASSALNQRRSRSVRADWRLLRRRHVPPVSKVPLRVRHHDVKSCVIRTSLLQICVICYSEILDIYRSCKKIDSALNTTHFEDTKLRQKISTVREEWKKEKAKSLNQKLQVRGNRCKLCSHSIEVSTS